MSDTHSMIEFTIMHIQGMRPYATMCHGGSQSVVTGEIDTIEAYERALARWVGKHERNTAMHHDGVSIYAQDSVERLSPRGSCGSAEND